MRQKLLLFCFGLFLFTGALFAQSIDITGTVKNEKGEPIPAASVKIEGSNRGTLTSNEGTFAITADEGDNLHITAIGYFSVTQLATQEMNITLRLSDASVAGDDVIVVGYSTSTKQAFTGSVATISSDRIANKSVSNVSQALAGEVPGVRVINTSGQPGTSATIRIRGFGSVNGNRDPLYVVDGIPFTSNVNSINPEDIQSLSVLSDAVATAIYGARGANGVVLITTKSGKSNKPFVEVSAKYGVNKDLLPRYQVLKSPDQYIGLAWEAMYNEGVIEGADDPVAYANKYLFSGNGIAPAYNLWDVDDVANLIDPVTRTVKSGVNRRYTPENWEDYAFQSSRREEVNLKMGGGDAKTNYYTSIGYLNDKGYSINSDFKRISARMNLTHEVNDWLSGTMNFGYTNSTTNVGGQDDNSNSVFWFVDNMPPIYPLFLRDENGKIVPDPYFGGNQYDYGDQGRGFGALTNAIADAHYNTDRHKRNDFNGNSSVKVKFTDNFSFKSQFGLQYYNDDYVNLTNKFYGSAASQNGSIYQVKTELMDYDWLNIFQYNKRFGEHNFEALAAHEATSFRQSYLYAFKSNLVQNDNEELDNAVVSSPSNSHTNRYKVESYFAQVNYDYKSTYYFSGSIRRDGSSRFTKRKWGNFGSLGLGWVVSNESFMQSSKVFKYLKLKASYGVIGDQSGVGYYPGFDLFEINNLNDNPAFSFDTKGNPDLTWEKAKVLQVGTEFRIGTVLDVSADYFVKNTDNLIFDRRVGPSIGYALIKVNDGSLRNQGLEFQLTGHVVKQKDLFVDLSINGEMLSNKLTRMPIDPATGQPKVLDIQGLYGRGKGHSIYDFYIREYKGVDPKDGTSSWTAYYEDADNNGQADDGEYIASLEQYKADNPDKVGDIKETTTKTYSQATQFYVGKSAIPKVRGGLNLNAGYKGFNLSVQMLYSFGGYAYDGQYANLMDNGLIGANNWSVDILDRWQKEGDITNVPRLSDDEDANVASSSTRFLTKSDYLSLNNVRLGYNLPRDFVNKYGIGEMSIWVSGDNIWLHSKRKGFNPSTAEDGSSDMYRYSPLSTFSAGIRVKF